jgi:Tol biopolymer transport system component/DNA-binding winged helix-turn-helix (wHTH) protein
LAGPVYQFADFRLDCGSFELLRKGLALRMERKPMELLILLVSRQGQLVTRTEIAQHLWSSEVFVDTEHGINTAIRKIRYVLRDDPDAPRILQTITGKGYRIICPVERLEQRPEVESAPAISSPSPSLPPAESDRKPQRFYAPRIALAILGAFLIAAAWYWFRPPPELHVTGYNPITHDGRGKEVVATDGSRIYLNEDFAPDRIKEVAISGGEVVPIKVPLPAAGLWGFSPDGSDFFVWSDDRGHQSLWSVQVPGGSIRHLVDGSTRSEALSPDGKSIVYSTPDYEIMVSNSDGTGAHRLFAAEDHKSGSNTDGLVWSPDSSRIRFTRDGKLWEMNAKGEGLHELLPGWRPEATLCCGRWTPDGRFFLFLLQDNLNHPFLPGNQLWSVQERPEGLGHSPGNPIQMTSGPLRWATPVPSKDGKKVFARGIILRGELVRYDAKSQQLQPWLGGISAEFVSYSPGGDSIAYVTFPEGVLWRANRDGSAPVQLTSPPLYPLNPHWSPDGTRILFFCADGKGRVKSYIVPAKGGPPEPLLPEDREDQIEPYWSPDGNKIVFSWPSGHRGNTNKILRVLDLKSRQVVTLPGSKGMWSPRWSPNGRYIAALNSSGGISVFDFQTGLWSELQKGERDFPTWSSDSRSVYFLWTLDAVPGLYRVPVSGGNPERIVDLKGFRFAGAVGSWMGLDPADTPMLLRDTGSDDIYALTVDEK